MNKQDTENSNVSESTEDYNFVSEKVNSKDIYKVFEYINNATNVGEDIIQLENKLLINSFCKEKRLFSDKFIYYSVASVVINVGIFTNNLNQIEMSFKKLMKIINILFDNDKLSYQQKLKLFNTICLKCEEVCRNLMDSSEQDNENDIEKEFSRIIYIIYSSLNDCRMSSYETEGYQKVKERKIS